MKISDITFEDVAVQIKLEYLLENESDKEALKKQLDPIMSAAKAYISSYTGIKIQADNEEDTSKTIDDYDDFYIAFMVLCQDMYDNRSMYVEKSNVNKVVSSILDMHCTNLL